MVLRIRLGCVSHPYRALTSLAGLPRPFKVLPTVLNAVLQPQVVVNLVWALPRSLATTNGIVSFPRATEMFQFTRFPCIKHNPGSLGWVSPFGYRRLLRLYTPRHRFSQYTASFIGTRCLDILHVPLIALSV